MNTIQNPFLELTPSIQKENLLHEEIQKIINHESFNDIHTRIQQQRQIGFKKILLDDDLDIDLKEAAADLQHEFSTDRFYSRYMTYNDVLKCEIQFLNYYRINYHYTTFDSYSNPVIGKELVLILNSFPVVLQSNFLLLNLLQSFLFDSLQNQTELHSTITLILHPHLQSFFCDLVSIFAI